MAVHNSKVRAKGSHLKEQALRFGRLFGAAFVIQVVESHGLDHPTITVLVSASVGAIEALVRQWAQTVPTGDVAVPVSSAAKTAPADVVYGDAAP